jgi:tetratricopeptide (TPR) repeat protein
MPSATATLEVNAGTSQEDGVVRAHLAQVIASREFAGAPRLAGFLKFVVETALAGDGDQIKESLIAVEVYGRRPDYNPQIDSTVRVEAGRLRARLRQYYEGSGGSEAVLIELPKGTYAPIFHQKPAAAAAPTPMEGSSEGPAAAKTRNSRIYMAACLILIAASSTGALFFGRTPSDVDPTTMELYHRAQELLRIPVLKNGVPQSLPASVVEAVRLFGEVTARSPRFAKGWMGLAEASEWEYELRGNQPAERLATAKAAAERAIELDPNLTEGWTLLTSILFYREWNFPAAEKACRRAIELDPRNTIARQRYIDLLRAQGRIEEARFEANTATRLQPTIAAFQVRKAVMLYEADKCDEAFPAAVAAADLTNQMPVYPMTLWVQGLCFEQGRQFDQAERMFRAALAYQPHDPWNEPALGHLVGVSGRHAEAEAILSELRGQLARGRLTHGAMALVYTGLGKNMDALASLDRAWAERDDSVLFIAMDPRLRPLHSEARFQTIVAGIRDGKRLAPDEADGLSATFRPRRY